MPLVLKVTISMVCPPKFALRGSDFGFAVLAPEAVELPAAVFPAEAPEDEFPSEVPSGDEISSELSEVSPPDISNPIDESELSFFFALDQPVNEHVEIIIINSNAKIFFIHLFLQIKSFFVSGIRQTHIKDQYGKGFSKGLFSFWLCIIRES